MRDNRMTEMINVRWKAFELNHRIPQNEPKNIIACLRCFAELIFVVEPQLMLSAIFVCGSSTLMFFIKMSFFINAIG